MRVSSIRLITRALALLVVSSLLTTCGDDGSSSKEDRGVFGEMADVLMRAETDYLTANAEIFASAEYMKPYIAALLDMNSAGVTSATTQTSCLPAGVGGRTYTINGTPFTSVADTLVDENKARFRLFRLSNAGQPLLNQEIGCIDYTCESFGSGITEVLIIADSVVVASNAYFSGDGLKGTATGLFRVPDGSGILFFHGGLKDGQLALDFELSADLNATYTSSIGTSSDSVTKSVIVHPDPEQAWNFVTDLWTNTSEAVDSGYALYLTSDSSLAACVQAGETDAPVYSVPSTDCYLGESVLLMSVNTAQLQAMSDSYQSLRHFWLAAANLVEICRSLVPAEP